MANYATLKAAIQAAIKQNGNNEITGNLLQAQLLSIINSLGSGYQFMGVATPSTNPGTPDGKIFYIGFLPGTYTYFDNAAFDGRGVVVFTYSTAWARKVLPELANEALLACGEEVTVTGDEGVANVIPLRLFAGKLYRFSNNGVGAVSLQTKQIDGTIITNIGTINVGYSLIYKAAQDTEYIGGYGQHGWGVTVEMLDNISYEVDVKEFCVNRLNDANFMLAENLYINGGLDGQGVEYVNNARAINVIPVSFPFDIKIKSTGYFFPYYYNDDKTLDRLGAWAQELTINAGQFFRLVLATTMSNTNPTPVATLVNMLTVENISKQVSNVIQQTVIKPGNPDLFEKGSIGATGNNDTYEAEKRVRSINIMTAEKTTVIRSLIQNAYICISRYDESGNFYKNESWSRLSTIPAGAKYRIQMRDINTGSVKTKEQIMAGFEIYTAADIVQSATPNIIYQSREGSVNSEAVPPNSVFAVKMAAENEYDRIRFTIRKTSDGELVCVHDATINNVARNSDGTQISDNVYVEQSTLEQLDAYDWGIAYGPQFAGAKTPRLADCLHFANIYNLGVSIEFNWTLTDADVSLIYPLFVKYNALNNLIVIGGGSAQKFPLVDKRINVYVGGTMADINQWVNYINDYKTGENKVYIQLYPMGTTPTTEFLTLCAQNEWLPYYSNVFNIDNFIAAGWENGLALIEAQNVGLVKTTTRNIGNKKILE